MEELVLGDLVPSLRSLAVTVRPPDVFSVTLKVCEPLTNDALAGRTALASLELIPTLSLILDRKFQFASTALTVTLKAVPAVWAVGVPVLPVVLPGAAVSPGTRSCSLAKAPALTVIAGLVFEALEPSVTSLAVKVCEPAVLSVTLETLV